MAEYQDIVATIGTYLKDGEKKYVTRKVGTLLETQNGRKIKLDASFNPAGCMKGDDGQVWLSCFDPKPRQDARAARQQPAHTKGGNDDFDSEFPTL